MKDRIDRILALLEQRLPGGRWKFDERMLARCAIAQFVHFGKGYICTGFSHTDALSAAEGTLGVGAEALPRAGELRGVAGILELLAQRMPAYKWRSIGSGASTVWLAGESVAENAVVSLMIDLGGSQADSIAAAEAVLGMASQGGPA
jgi:hypothetical protein